MAQTKVPLVSPLRRIDIDKWGERFLLEYYPDTLRSPTWLDVDDLVTVLLPSEFDIDIGLEDLPPTIQGVTEPPNRLILDAAAYEGIDKEGSHRFTGTHEASHALGHLPQIQARYESSHNVKMFRRSEIPAFRDPEWQANRGAAALLMPATSIRDFVARYGPDAPAAAEAYGVSYTAAAYRIDDVIGGRIWSRSSDYWTRYRDQVPVRWPGIAA